MRFLLIVIVLLNAIGTFADYSVRRIDRIGREKGLSNSLVLGFEQDKFGVIWVATEGGLNRFDGKNFTVYRHDPLHPNSLSCNSINRLLCDADGNLWIATPHQGLDMYRHESDDFVHYVPSTIGNSISSLAITDLCLSYENNLWIATYFDGLNYFDIKKQHFTHYKVDEKNPHSIRENIITRVHEDRQKQLWIGYRSRGISVLDIQTQTMAHYEHNPNDPYSIPSNVILAIMQDRYDNIWIGTEKGLALYNKQQNNFYNLYKNPNDPNSLLSNKVVAIKEMTNGEIWIGTENGGISIVTLHYSVMGVPQIAFKNIESGDTENLLSHNSVYSLFQDSFENIWIGTYGGGIHFVSHYPDVFNRLKYIPFSHQKSNLNHKTAWGMCEAPDGKIWVGTDGGGINVLDPVTREIDIIKASPSTLGDNAILCALHAKKSASLWFGTYQGGVTSYNTHTGKFKTYTHHSNDPKSLPSVDVRALYEEKNGRVLIATIEGLALYCPDDDNFEVMSYYSHKLLTSDCRAILQDMKGNYWIGHQGGITLMDSTFTVKEYFRKDSRQEKSIPSNIVFCLYLTSDGLVWIGTEEGLCSWNYETQSFTWYTTANGMGDNSIKAINRGEGNDLWLSTNNGITRYDRDNNKFYNFNDKEGVPQSEFMDNSTVRGGDGTLYFGSRDGVCFFKPSLLSQKIEIPQIIFTRFDLFNEPLSPQNTANIESPLSRNVMFADPIELEYNQNIFTIHYAISNFALQKKAQYRYQMEGVDEQWVDDKESGYASYKNLSPGKYHFNVSASLDGEQWSDRPTTLLITILPPFWWCWWSISIYILVFLITSFYFYKVYLRKRDLEHSLLIEKIHLDEIEQLNKEKLQFFTNISHEIKTPLTLIVSPLEDVLRGGTFDANSKRKLELVSKNSNLLLNLFNKLLDFRKIEGGHSKLYLERKDIIKTVYDVCISYKELKNDSQVVFNYESQIPQLIIYYDVEKIFSIVDNLLSNAFKYTRQGEISLSMQIEEIEETTYLVVHVKDTGVGLTTEEQQRIFDRFYQVKNTTSVEGTGIGLSLVKNFVTLHHGFIEVESECGKGTQFSVFIDCRLEDKEEVAVTRKRLDVTETEGDGDKKQILIVDDNADIREYVSSCFDAEYSVTCASSGEEALGLAIKDLPDIVISDVMMSGMDGYTLCKTLKTHETTNHIPIILLTAKNTTLDKRDGYDAGADSYISKPFSSDLLVVRVRNIIESRRKITDHLSKVFFSEEDEEKPTLEVKQNKLIIKLTELVENNMSDDCLDIEFLSSRLNMSHSSLFRKVKALTGLSINEFVRGVRMQRAKEYLQSNEFTISEVAFKVGINSLRYFRQCFKELYGVTPTYFIKNNTAHRNKEDRDLD